jgi:hypothetical protein
MTSLAIDTGQTCSYFMPGVLRATDGREVQKLHEQLQLLHWRAARPRQMLHRERAVAWAAEKVERTTMNGLARGLLWPVMTLVAIGSTHLVTELIRPEMQAVFAPSVVMPIYLVAGGWAAFATLRTGSGLAIAVAAAAILGVLPVGLQLIGFGVLLGRDGATVTSSALFGFVAILWGGFLGAGIGRSLAEPAEAQASAARNRNTGAAVA